MKNFSNNAELYEYLLHLSRELKVRGAGSLSEVLVSASGTAAGMSTEFLGESRIALKKVLKEENGVLKDEEKNELRFALVQIDKAMDGRFN